MLAFINLLAYAAIFLLTAYTLTLYYRIQKNTKAQPLSSG